MRQSGRTIDHVVDGPNQTTRQRWNVFDMIKIENSPTKPIVAETHSNTLFDANMKWRLQQKWPNQKHNEAATHTHTHIHRNGLR